MYKEITLLNQTVLHRRGGSATHLSCPLGSWFIASKACAHFRLIISKVALLFEFVSRCGQEHLLLARCPFEVSGQVKGASGGG